MWPYLSSFKLGDLAEIMFEYCGDRKITTIGNMLDFIPDAGRRQYEANVYSPSAEFKGTGINSRDLDLRACFGRPEQLAHDLRRFEMVWPLGGNAFLLMHDAAKQF